MIVVLTTTEDINRQHHRCPKSKPSTTDRIFSAKYVLEESQESNIDIFQLLFGFHEAYDSINHTRIKYCIIGAVDNFQTASG